MRAKYCFKTRKQNKFGLKYCINVLGVGRNLVTTHSINANETKNQKKTTMNNYCSKKKDEMMIKCYAKERVCAAQIDMQAKHF